MTVGTKALREQRVALVKQAQDVLGRHKVEKRVIEQCEVNQYETIMEDVDKLGAEIDRAERLETANRSLSASLGRQVAPSQPGRLPDVTERRGGFVETKSTGGDGASAELRAWDSYFRDGSTDELRALSSDSDTLGGYLTVPQQLVAGVLKGLDNALPIRTVATRHTLAEASSLGVVALDADPADAVWTSELATGSEDSTMAFGKRVLQPRPVAKRIKVSRTLLRQAPSAATIVQDRLTYKFAVTAEQAYMTGDGANKPLGLFTASTDGITTARDVSTGNTSTAVTMDGLINALYSLKSSYLASKNLRWLFHRDALKQIRKLRDDSGAGAGTGGYLWQPSTQLGQPDLLLGIPVLSSEYVPNTFTTGLYVGLIGDFSYYWIADALSMTIQRLDELYAESNQVGFIGRLETDGMPVLAEAFARVKLA